MITFELADLISFFFGIIAGLLIFTVTFVFLAVRGRNLDAKKIHAPSYRVSENKIKKLVISHQNKLRRSIRLNKNNAAKLTFDTSYELIEDIAKFYFPDSKYPMLEISVHELLDLAHYVANSIEGILDKPLLRNSRNVRMTQIMNAYDKMKSAQDSRALKFNKKYRLDKAFKYSMMTLNAFNPVYWFRKVVINQSLEAITRKICVVVVGVVGEETTKVYSKKVFGKEDDLQLVDEQIQNILDELDDEENITN